ncbi:MAG: GHMP kinase [Winogradskyella sp.]|nr:MAG: GHMP kinase [Winogradskyella sp.]
MVNYRSNGKLLLTGEYLVLDGTKSLALPTTYGQKLLVENNSSNTIIWKSFDENNKVWFKDEFSLDDILLSSYTSENEISQRLIDILKSINTLNPDFLKRKKGFNIKTTQDFNRTWGLGTSSTLINNIANWANVDAYKLLELTFGGSGYDIACAQNDTSITYQLIDGKPIVTEVNFNPSFKDCIYFVYLNQKQNSRDGITAYRNSKSDLKTSISEINRITEAFILCDSLDEFENLIIEHEHIISRAINQPPVKGRLFTDFDGAIKSLGAWGGDFVLVTSKDNPSAYFKSKGYHTILSYSQMIKA